MEAYGDQGVGQVTNFAESLGTSHSRNRAIANKEWYNSLATSVRILANIFQDIAKYTDSV